MVQEIKNKNEFDELVNQDKVTVVDFYATWCGPCRQIAPFVQKLSDQYKEANFVKVDVDENEDISAEYGVRAMPTFMLFQKGEKVGEVVGANPNALKTIVSQHVSN